MRKRYKITKICEECGNPFEVHFYRAEIARFCSYECYWNNLGYRPVKTTCNQCGNETIKKHADYKRNTNSFCSRECYAKWLSENQIGEKAPQWKGGISFEVYPTEFNEKLKETIRKRDNYTCQMCGMTKKESLEKSNRRLAVHHIDGNKDNNDEENLVTLCISCNTKLEHWLVRPQFEVAIIA